MTASDRPEIGGWVAKRISELTPDELVHISDCVVQAMQRGAHVPHEICVELADEMAKRSEAIWTFAAVAAQHEPERSGSPA